MRSSDIDKYFRKVVLSDDIGNPETLAGDFHFALSATQSELNDSLMIGDSWEMILQELPAWECIRCFIICPGVRLAFYSYLSDYGLKELLDLL